MRVGTSLDSIAVKRYINSASTIASGSEGKEVHVVGILYIQYVEDGRRQPEVFTSSLSPERTDYVRGAARNKPAYFLFHSRDR